MSVRARIGEELAAVLAAREDASVPELLTALRSAGLNRVPRSQVEQVLGADQRFVAEDVAGRSRWRLNDGPDPDPDPDPGPDTRAQLDALALRPWQAEALAAWSATCRGVVEAVTGTGKTRLAMAAIRTVADRGGRSLVLVPTLDLQEQWVRELRVLVPGLSVGRLGGGGDDDLHGHRVVVATPQSAATVPLDLPAGVVGLLVADEAHRYGAASWGRALAEDFVLRLALTATYERSDDGLVEVLEPYFGPVVFRYGYDRAVREGSVAPFRLALVGVPLSAAEQVRHHAADARVRALHHELVGGLGMPREPTALLAAVAAVVAEAQGAQDGGRQVRACREYLVRLRERREVAATAAAKLEVCTRLAPALAGRRTLVFTDTVEQAEAAAGVLTAGGRRAAPLHGGLDARTRRERLAALRHGRLEVVVAPRVLDEGVDVPDAEVALVLAAFRTRRQLVQRLGRVLRIKADAREARLVLVTARGTLEDPARGGHAEFLTEIRPVAREVVEVDLPAGGDALVAWLTRPRIG